MIDIIAQVVIFVFGVGAIYLVNDPRPKVSRYGCLVALVAQPAWFYTTFSHHQWGMFAASLFYGYSWSRGFYYQWIKNV